jgi:two-component sensor histidine kinase
VPEREIRAARETGRSENERWHLRRDGSRFWGSGVLLPLSDGRHDSYLKIFRDRTEERKAEKRQRLLTNELNHRVKNTLATVQSIVAQTLRGTVVGEDARGAVEGRLLALSRSHDLLTRESWESAGLRDVAAQALEPYGAPGGQPTRVAVQGPDLRLQPKAAVALGMALHELATNAAKHGALSNGAGRVDLSWRITPSASGDRLRLEWLERGGPPVQPPSRKGFGSRLLERGLAHELDGEVRLDHEPSGVLCRIDIPVPAGRGVAEDEG